MAGRAPTCVLRLQDHGASNNHASVFWTGERWEARDLGSTNGTFVDERMISLKENVQVSRGNVLRFGSNAECWELVDDRGPVVVARATDADDVQAAENGLLALPGPDHVLVSIVTDSDGGWLVETPDGVRRPAQDGEHLTVAGQVWELTVPPVSLVAGTHRAQVRPSIWGASLRFYVSLDEEHVRLEVVNGDDVLSLGERASFYLLLSLARERRRDQANPGMNEAEHGWVHVDDLAQELGLDERHFNVAIFRVRLAFASAEVVGAEAILERRPRMIRIGVGQLEEIKT